jgi:hypothetical protein
MIDLTSRPLDRGTTQSRIGVISLCRVVSTSEPNSCTDGTEWIIFDAWIAVRSSTQRTSIQSRFTTMKKKRSQRSAALE